MYVSDESRERRDPQAIARAHELLRRQTMALRHYENGLTQRTSAEMMGVSQASVGRLLAKLELTERAS